MINFAHDKFYGPLNLHLLQVSAAEEGENAAGIRQIVADENHQKIEVSCGGAPCTVCKPKLPLRVAVRTP